MQNNFYFNQVLELLFPRVCVGCNTSGELLCHDCFADLEFVEQICIECGAPSERGVTHAQCAGKHSASRLFCVCDYRHNLTAKIVTALKYNLIKDLDITCAQIIFKALIERNALPDEDFVITFVPMHKTKQSLRGFNQSQLIAEKLSALLQMSVLPMLEKQRPTKAQMTLDRKERLQNLAGAFTAAQNGNKPVCASKRVLLVDDVITTGATLRECAKTLLSAGAGNVQCIAFAKD
ncbi:ComF family protein [Patescibacteria group bacterium]|nr:ComF family protein [Patescibacteria group bacterium]